MDGINFHYVIVTRKLAEHFLDPLAARRKRLNRGRRRKREALSVVKALIDDDSFDRVESWRLLYRETNVFSI